MSYEDFDINSSKDTQIAKVLDIDRAMETKVEAYFSADVETDGPIPGPFSALSFAIVFAGTYDGDVFSKPKAYNDTFYREMKPISNEFEIEALRVNGLDREKLARYGDDPEKAMAEAFKWVTERAGAFSPVLVAYPLSFDWTWLYWYFIRFCPKGSPFGYSRCFDIKTAVAVKGGSLISEAGRSRLPTTLVPDRPHTHNALDDAIEQAEIFANVFQWEGRKNGGNRRASTLHRETNSTS